MRLILTTTFAVAALSLGGGATQSAAQHDAATLGGPASRVVELPGTPSAGEPREVQVLVNELALKLASIALRGATLLRGASPMKTGRYNVGVVLLTGVLAHKLWGDGSAAT